MSKSIAEQLSQESTSSDSLTVGTPNPNLGNNSAISEDTGTALGQSVWIPQISLELYMRATKDPAFAIRYYTRIMKFWGIYRSFKAPLEQSIEQVRALRSHNSITLPNGATTSLRVLQFQDRKERQRQEKTMRDQACKVLGIDPKVLELLKKLNPDQLQNLV